MSRFFKSKLSYFDLKDDKNFTTIGKLGNLIEDSDFKSALTKIWYLDDRKSEVISIVGLNQIMNSILLKDKEFEKIDIESHASNIICKPNEKGSINLIFKENNILKDPLVAEAVYDTKKEYLDNFYKLDKFTDFCIKNDCFELVQNNIESLNNKFKDSNDLNKRYRLLKDADDNFFVRAITSINSYHDYNIKFSLFVTIITLHDLMVKNNIDFDINRVEYSESYIKIFFKKNTITKIDNIGTLSYVLEMSNDEIKRGAFKFSSLFLITFFSDEDQIYIYVKPKKTKAKLVSIKHNFNPTRVISSLEDLGKLIENSENEMIEDIKDFHKIKNPDQLRYKLLRKIETSKSLGDYKDTLRVELNKKISTISELLKIMSNVDEITEDLEIKEYLRYIFYDILISKK